VRTLCKGVRVQRVACKACLGIVEVEHAEARKREGKLYSYQCIGCRYKFSRTASNAPQVCPQCSRKDFIKFEPEKLSASAILKIADDPRLDRLEA
jgi:DNA-directed RNA polymerase subunit RPC12/RpoP